MTNRLRVALIGAGIFTRKAHVPALLTLQDRYEIAAVYSRTRESAEAVNELLPQPVPVFQDLDAVLAQDDIDVINIILPIHVQAEALGKALRSGKHVISEKPIAPTAYEAEQLIDLHQQQSQQLWMVAENFRYSPAAQHAAKLIEQGAIGRPVLGDWTVHVSMTPDNPYYNTPWRRDNSFPGGFLLDGGVHHVAMLRLILGEVEEVSAQTQQFRDDLPPVDTMAASLRFENGALLNYAVTFVQGTSYRPMLNIMGDRGLLRVSFQEVILITDDGEEKFTFEETDLVAAELEAFAKAITNKASHLNTPEEALRDVQVIEALLYAGETRQYVRLLQ
jgi:predicted dehydrogenase